MNGLISNYVTVALRGFHREPGYLGIAIASLSLALLIALLALSHIRFELSYDDWLSSKDRNYRLQSSQYPPGRPMRPLTSAPAAIVPALSNQIAGLEEIAMGFGSAIALSTNDFAFITPVHYATSNFLAFFEVEAIYGDAQQTLDDPLAIVLTSSQAKRIFGHNDVVGQVVSVDGHTDLRVGAIIPDWPENSHLSIDALTSINSPTFSDKELFLENWGSVGGAAYISVCPLQENLMSCHENSIRY